MRNSQITTTIPGGIGSQDLTCWHLVYAGGHPVDTGDCVPHFDTEAQARQEAGHYTIEALGEPQPGRLDAPCWIARAVCGYRFDEEGSALMHHESAEDALRAVLDSGMLIGPCGDLHCSPDCDECQQDCGVARA